MQVIIFIFSICFRYFWIHFFYFYGIYMVNNVWLIWYTECMNISFLTNVNLWTRWLQGSQVLCRKHSLLCMQLFLVSKSCNIFLPCPTFYLCTRVSLNFSPSSRSTSFVSQTYLIYCLSFIPPRTFLKYKQLDAKQFLMS